MQGIKKDSVLLGFVLGIIGPVIGFVVYYYAQASHRFTLLGFWHFVVRVKLLSPVLSLCLIMDLVIFFIFIALKWDKSSRGDLMATFLYAGVVAYLKFFW